MSNRLLIDGMDKRTLLADGMIGSSEQGETDPAFKQKRDSVPFKDYAYTRARVAVDVPANSQVALNLRGMGNAGYVSNPTLSGDGASDVSIVSVGDNNVDDVAPAVMLAGGYYPMARLNRNFQTGNNPRIGTIQKIYDFPGEVDQVRCYPSMDTDGGIYFNYTNLSAARRNAKLDKDLTLEWDVADFKYLARTATTPHFALSVSGEMARHGAPHDSYFYLYDTVSGAYTGSATPGYPDVSEPAVFDALYGYADKNFTNDDIWRYTMAGVAGGSFSGNSERFVTRMLSVFGGVGYCTAYNPAYNLYSSSFANSATLLISDFELMAQDSLGNFYGWSRSTDNLEKYTLAGSLVWSVTRASLSISSYIIGETTPVSFVVDDVNDRIMFGYKSGSGDVRLAVVSSVDGTATTNHGRLLQNQISESDTTMMISTDRYGYTVCAFYRPGAGGGHQDESYLLLYDFNDDNILYTYSKTGWIYTHITDGIFNGLGLCTGWGKFVWGNDSTDGSNVGGLYIME